MDRSGLERVYSCKTDDELHTLAVERKSLEPQAQSVLWDELRRRELTLPLLPHTQPSDRMSGENPAWNLPAKSAAVVMLVGWGALGLRLVIAVAREHQLLNLLLLSVVSWGPLLAAIPWGTKRALRNREHSHSPTRSHRRQRN